MSQYQCGGPSSQNPYRSMASPSVTAEKLCRRSACAHAGTSGINLPFGRLSPGHGQVGYALLTHPPVATRDCKQSPCCPSTCMC